MQPHHDQEGMDEPEARHLAFWFFEILDEFLAALLCLKGCDLRMESGFLGCEIDIPGVPG